MADFTRFISYFYDYRAGERNRNLGFAKVESRQGMCRLTVCLNHGQVLQRSMMVCGYLADGGEIYLVRLGEMDRGIRERQWKFPANDLGGSGLGLEKLDGLILVNEERSFYLLSVWNDGDRSADEIRRGRLWDKSRREKEKSSLLIPAEAAERFLREDEPTAVNSPELPENEPMAWDRDETLPEAGASVRERNEAVPEAEAPAWERNEAVPEVKAPSWERNETAPEAGSSDRERNEAFPETEPSDRARNEASPEGDSSARERQEALPPEGSAKWKRETGLTEREPSGEKKGGSPSMDGLPAEKKLPEDDWHTRYQTDRENDDKAMRVTAPAIWKNLCQIFPAARPFEPSAWEVLCISLQDIGRLPPENWVWGSNHFLLHGFYQYRHLILARQRIENRIYLGVPGEFGVNEKFMAAMFGLHQFQRERQGKSDKGYWLTEVKL